MFSWITLAPVSGETVHGGVGKEGQKLGEQSEAWAIFQESGNCNSVIIEPIDMVRSAPILDRGEKRHKEHTESF
jgi:hypothetical protein